MSGESLDRIARTLRGEYREMPGLRLTRAQIQRLYGLDALSCDELLVRLVNEHFLSLTESNRFCRADESSAATR